jgi:NADH-quinone oxidoreductase subunit L
MIALLVICLPLVGAAVALVVGHRDERVAPIAGVASVAAAWVFAMIAGVTQWGDRAAAVIGPREIDTGGIPLSAVLSVDQLSASMLVLATSVAALVQVYSVAYLKGDPRFPSYAALVCLFTSAMSLVVSADDLFVLLVGWEVMGACSYFLISHHWELEEARDGAVKAFVMTRLGDVGLLIGIFVVGQAAGTYRISGVVEAAASGRISEGQATAATLLMLCGVVGKSAQFPLHSWLPDAMPGPTPISALIHAATMVAAGVFLVARLLPLFLQAPVTLTVLAVIAAVTMLGSALLALVSDDLKRVLAWSTVSQLAYMFAALSLGGYAAGILHLLSHGAFKALLFLAAGSVIHAIGTQRLDSMGGLRRSMPITFVTMTIGFAALAGVPPVVGFFSKDEVLGLASDEAFDGHQEFRAWLILVIGLVTVALTAAYSMRAWLMVFCGPRRTANAMTEPHESPRLMTGPLVALAGVTVLGGAFVVFRDFLGVERESPHYLMMLVSVLVVAASLGFTAAEWWRFDRTDPAKGLGRWRRVLVGEFGYDKAVDATVVRPVREAVRVVAATEEFVVDPYVRGAATGTNWTGQLVRWLHDGNLQRYVTAVVVGAVAVAVIVGLVQ